MNIKSIIIEGTFLEKSFSEKRKFRVKHFRGTRGDEAVEQLVSLNPQLSARVEIDSDFL